MYVIPLSLSVLAVIPANAMRRILATLDDRACVTRDDKKKKDDAEAIGAQLLVKRIYGG